MVHAAAYTNVDGCEQDPDLAYRVNVLGTQNVALGAQRSGAALMYVSTNEVFDGQRREPYREWDRTAPLSAYARSKTAGEEIVRQLLTHFYIVRVAWLFGPGGVNFVTKILGAAAKTGALRVAADEFGNPTYAPDVAQAMARLATTGHYGIYHLTNSGFCSRYELQPGSARPTEPTYCSILAMRPRPQHSCAGAAWPRCRARHRPRAARRNVRERTRGAAGHDDPRLRVPAARAADRLAGLALGLGGNGAGVDNHRAGEAGRRRGAADDLALESVEPAAEGDDLVVRHHAQPAVSSSASNCPRSSVPPVRS